MALQEIAKFSNGATKWLERIDSVHNQDGFITIQWNHVVWDTVGDYSLGKFLQKVNKFNNLLQELNEEGGEGKEENVVNCDNFDDLLANAPYVSREFRFI